MFSMLARWWFASPIHDVYCGLRGFTKALYNRLDQRCTGMEFATEMIIKASLYGARIAEVPITLHPDGRTSHPPHLKTFRDGWRTLRFFLMYSPRWLFLLPGMVLILLGLLAMDRSARCEARRRNIRRPYAAVCQSGHPVRLSVRGFCDIHQIFAIAEGLMPEDQRMNQFFKIINLERGLIIALLILLIGVALLVSAIGGWQSSNFGSLDYAHTMRLVVPGVTLTALGFQTILSSFFASILGMRRR